MGSHSITCQPTLANTPRLNPSQWRLVLPRRDGRLSWPNTCLMRCFAGMLAKNAVDRGLSVMPYIKTSLSPGSGVVCRYLDYGNVVESLRCLRSALVISSTVNREMINLLTLWCPLLPCGHSYNQSFEQLTGLVYQTLLHLTGFTHCA